DAMDVGDPGYGRLLLEVVVQIEAEADAHEDPEQGEPDQRSPAIFARRPGRGCMDVHPLFPPSPSEKRTTMGLMRWSPFLHRVVVDGSGNEPLEKQPPEIMELGLSHLTEL